MKVLLVIDLQEQFRDSDGRYEKCIDFINSHTNEYLVVGTVFRNRKGSMFTKHLGWDGCMDTGAGDIRYNYHHLLEKTGYALSTVYLEKAVAVWAKSARFPNNDASKVEYYIMGCDADACVLATAFKMWDRGMRFKLLADHIYTTAEEYGTEDVIKIYRRNFGNCVIQKKNRRNHGKGRSARNHIKST